MKTLMTEDIVLICSLIASSFGLTVFLLPKLIRFIKEKGLLDIPNWRSAHKEPTPSYGGVVFVPALLLPLIFAYDQPEITVLIISSVFLSFFGVLDDLKDINHKIKFGLQFIFASLLYLVGYKLTNLYGIFGVYYLSEEVSFALTVFVILGIINAFNLIDGIDCLAGGLGLIASVVFSIIFFNAGNFNLMIVAIVFASTLLGFLVFNFAPARIFMGDTGSLVLGLIMSAFFLEGFQYSEGAYRISSLSLVLIPCVDMLRLFISRTLRKRSPFKADKSHFHHMLVMTLGNHMFASLTCFVITLIFVVLSNLILKFFPFSKAVLLVIGSGVLMYLYTEILFILRANRNLKNASGKAKEALEENNLLKPML